MPYQVYVRQKVMGLNRTASKGFYSWNLNLIGHILIILDYYKGELHIYSNCLVHVYVMDVPEIWIEILEKQFKGQILNIERALLSPIFDPRWGRKNNSPVKTLNKL